MTSLLIEEIGPPNKVCVYAAKGNKGLKFQTTSAKALKGNVFVAEWSGEQLQFRVAKQFFPEFQLLICR